MVRAPEGGVPVWVSRGSLRRAADFSRSPHGHPKNTYKGRDSLCRYGNRFKLFAGANAELWMFVLAIAVLLVVLAAIVLRKAFR